MERVVCLRVDWEAHFDIQEKLAGLSYCSYNTHKATKNIDEELNYLLCKMNCGRKYALINVR